MECGSVEQGWFERLAEVMARMAGGDTSALEMLYVGFGDPIRSLIRKELRRLGVSPIDPADVDGLTLDVCTDLFRRAASWDPAHGVAPWTWARLRVRALVCEFVGPFTDPLPDEGLADVPVVSAPVAEADTDDVLAALDRLAGRRPGTTERSSRPAWSSTVSNYTHVSCHTLSAQWVS